MDFAQSLSNCYHRGVTESVWKGNSVAEPESKSQGEYPYITNTECPHFPCHQGADPDNFNCLFCFCPLYALGPCCGGNFRYTEKGVKDCTPCILPHLRDNGNRLVAAKFSLLRELARDTRAQVGEDAGGEARLG